MDEVDTDPMRVIEIAENLRREDLTKLERAEQTAEDLELEKKVAQLRPPGMGAGSRGGTRAASREPNAGERDGAAAKRQPQHVSRHHCSMNA